MSEKVRKHIYIVDGHQFEVGESGQGEPVLMLQVWHPYAKYFGQNLPQAIKRRVITVDVPGYYNGRQANPVTDVGQLVDLLEKLFDQMRLGQVDVVGQCLGGVIGVLLAAKYPKRIKKLVFATPPFMYWEPGVNRTVRSYFALLERGKRRKKWLAYVMRKSILAKMADFFGGYHGVMGLIARDAARSKSGFDERVFFGILGSTFRCDLWKEMGKVECPVLLVAGERDKNGRNGKLKKAQEVMKKAEVKIIPRARHAMVLKNTQQFHQEVMRFLFSLLARERLDR